MPTERNDKKIKIYSLVALALTVVAVMVRTCCLIWFYDEDIGYYTRDVLPTLFEVLCPIAVVFFFSAFFILKPHNIVADGKEDNVALKISSALAAIAFGVFFVISVLSTSLVTGNVVFDLVSKISSLAAIVYFAMNLFAPYANRTAQTALGFGIIIWNICVLGITYFDIYIQLNSPEKIILHLALVSAMVFFVSEFKCFVGVLKSKMYLFSVSCAMFFLGTCSIPSIVGWSIGIANGKKYSFYNIVLFALFVYCTTRLFSFAFANISYDKNTVEQQES